MFVVAPFVLTDWLMRPGQQTDHDRWNFVQSRNRTIYYWSNNYHAFLQQECMPLKRSPPPLWIHCTTLGSPHILFLQIHNVPRLNCSTPICWVHYVSSKFWTAQALASIALCRQLNFWKSSGGSAELCAIVPVLLIGCTDSRCHPYFAST
jgi:hypothetical protein